MNLSNRSAGRRGIFYFFFSCPYVIGNVIDLDGVAVQGVVIYTAGPESSKRPCLL